MKIITQSETPKYPFYLHLGYVSANEPVFEVLQKGFGAFLAAVVLFLALKAVMTLFSAKRRDEILNSDGNALFNEKKYEEALECYEQAIKYNRNNEQNYFNKGHALMKLGKKAEATECFKKFLELSPNAASSEAAKEIIEALNREEA